MGKRKRRKALKWMNLKKKKKNNLVFLIITKGDHRGTGQAELRVLVALVSLPVLPHHLG